MSTAGSQTSEFKLTKWVLIAGLSLDAIGILLESLKGVADFGWIPSVLIVVGSLMALVKALGYTRSRTMVKLAEATPKVAVGVAELVPLAKELAAEVKSSSAPAGLPTPPSPQS